MTITEDPPSPPTPPPPRPPGVRGNWRNLSVPAKVRLRWLLKARDNQLTPDSHILCTGEDCQVAIREAWKLYPRRVQGEDRIRYLQERGHFDWWVWLILSGRGWGKTRSGAEDVARYMMERPRCRVALVAATFADGRDTMVEGESGLLTIIPKTLIQAWNRSLGELVLTNGARAKIFSSEEPERLRGPQHHRAWADELASWTKLKSTWDMLMFGLRLQYRLRGKAELRETPQVIVTTTPKGLKWIRKRVRLSVDPREGIVLTRGRTRDNAPNLAHVTLKALQDTYAGTRIGRQELEGEVLEEDEGSAIRYSDVEDWRFELRDLPELEDHLGRIVLAIDPAVTSKRTSNETGMVVAGLSRGRCPVCPRSVNPDNLPHAFVLDDCTPGRVSPAEWAEVAVRKFRRWRCDRVIGEVNNGGDLVETNLRAVAPTLPYKSVHASRGKVVRLEPVAALYEKGWVHHVGTFPLLEDQLVQLGRDTTDDDDTDDSGRPDRLRQDTSGDAPPVEDDEPLSDSPDRADALVWALTELMVPDDAIVVVGSAQDHRGRGSR